MAAVREGKPRPASAVSAEIPVKAKSVTKAKKVRGSTRTKAATESPTVASSVLGGTSEEGRDTRLVELSELRAKIAAIEARTVGNREKTRLRVRAFRQRQKTKLCQFCNGSGYQAGGERGETMEPCGHCLLEGK